MKKLTFFGLFLILSSQSMAIGLPNTNHPTTQSEQVVYGITEDVNRVMEEETTLKDSEELMTEERTQATDYAQSIIDKIVEFMAKIFMNLFSSSNQVATTNSVDIIENC